MDGPENHRPRLSPTAVPMPWWAGVFLPSLALVSIYGLVSLFTALRDVAAEATEGAPLTVDVGTMGGLSALAFLATIVVGWLLFGRGESLRDALQIRPVRWELVLATVVLGVSLQFPLTELSNLISEFAPVPLEDQLAQHTLLFPDNPVAALGVLLAVVLIAPLTEELLFRGLLLPGLSKGYGAAFAVLFTSVAFAVVHLRLQVMGPALISGLVLGWVLLRSCSVLACISLHASVNAVPLLLSPRMVEIRGFNVLSESVLHLPLPFVIACTLISLSALYLIHRLTV